MSIVLNVNKVNLNLLDSMMPSIFNDVIGPVMRGPSSSHTAASHRIGQILRQICPPENCKVVVEFDRKGSLSTTYEGQGTSMGLISGLLGIGILDPSIVRYRDLAKEHNLNIEFQITDFKASHPNTYKIQIENLRHEKFHFIAVSTGGGMMEVQKINEYDVSIKGDYYETLVCCETILPEKIQDLFQLLVRNTVHSGIKLIQKGENSYLVNIKSRSSLFDKVTKILNNSENVTWIRGINPVMPILGGSGKELPFASVDEMLKLAELKGFDLADMAILYETSRSGIDSQGVMSLMQDIVLTIKNSIEEGLKGTRYKDRILGHQSHLILEAEKKKKIIQSQLNTIIAYVTALMESKSSMGIIVAAPTAGSTGVLGGVVFGVAEGFTEEIDTIVRAFLAAGLIGVFIADKYTFAAEEGGCQVECGAASAMAAAGLVQLMGGTARQAINASSMALQNLLGLVCDPVADRVEVPCLGKNILGATNALNAANMSIAGFDPVIPLDEVIDAMKSVGESMPSSLCCTGLGGLSITPTSIRILEELKKNRQQNQ
jgi:L-serine dehydratase